MSSIDRKKVYIVDMDGTLYSQKKMRMSMMLSLVKYYIVHIYRWKELACIYLFRKLRELEEYQSYSMNELYSVVGKKLHLSEKQVEAVIQKWMFQVPLAIMKQCAYDNVIDYLNRCNQDGAKIYIYSDYPAEEKAKVLGIQYDNIFVSEEISNGELKPSKSAMEHILSKIGTNKEDVLYVGDREEKDGIAAKMAGIDYLDIQWFRKSIS